MIYTKTTVIEDGRIQYLDDCTRDELFDAIRGTNILTGFICPMEAWDGSEGRFRIVVEFEPKKEKK